MSPTITRSPGARPAATPAWPWTPSGYPVEQVNISGSTSTPDWYYQDPEANTRVLLSLSGAVDHTYNHDDYGNALPGTDTSGPTTQLLSQSDLRT